MRNDTANHRVPPGVRALGCLLLLSVGPGLAAETGLIFDHQRHEQIPCATCHQLDNPAEPSRPPEKVCSLCHAVGDRAQPDAGCAMCHSRPDHRVEGLQRRTYADSRFLHEPHLQAKLPCLACHKEQRQAQSYRQIHFPAMTECISCHVKRRVSTDCQVCHKYWRADVVPDYHDDHWLRRHGQFVRQQFDERCTACHQEKTFCQDCHTADAPPWHTLFFKNRGHGAMARAHRETCQACHQQESCQECHNPETGVRPASHPPNFASPPYPHCAQCHFPAGEANGCSACHSAARIAAQHDATVMDESKHRVAGFAQVNPDCMSGCHMFNLRRPSHPLGTMSSSDCLRCHIP